MGLSAPFAFSPRKQDHEIMNFTLGSFSVSILLPECQEPGFIVSEDTNILATTFLHPSDYGGEIFNL